MPIPHAQKLKNAIKATAGLLRDRIVPKLSFLWEGLVLLWLLVTPGGESSLKRAADKEIKALRKKSKAHYKFRYGWGYWLTEWMDNYKWPIVIVLFLLFVSFTLWLNLAPVEIPLPYYQLRLPLLDFLAPAARTDNYHAVMAAIQATLLGLIIPITVALHEFVLKDEKLKEEIINLILKDTRVRLITISSLAFLICMVAAELGKALFEDFAVSRLSSLAAGVWLAGNLALLGYFMFTALKLLNRSFLNAAMRRFIVNQSYPEELKGYFKGYTFLKLSSSLEEGEA